MTVFIELNDVLYIHAEQIRLFGGSDGVPDMAVIESAVMRPQSGNETDTIALAASLWESLTMNHGFIDGNKRVAFAAMDVFLGRNGWRLEAEPAAILQFIYHHLEGGTFRKAALEEWLRANCAKL